MRLSWGSVKPFVYLANLPLYWLTRVTPRVRNRWVFGAWGGVKWADNSRHFMEYVEAHHPEIEAVWVTCSKEVQVHLKSTGRRAVLAQSWQGYWYVATAALGIVSNGFGDLNKFVSPPVVLNLWHGIPLKRIEFDSPVVAQRLSKRLRVARLFPFHERRNYAAIVTSSVAEADVMASAFRTPRDRVHVLGQPRNDCVVREVGEPRSGLRSILYAPTFRDTRSEQVVELLVESLPAIEQFLESRNMALHVRLHPHLRLVATPKSERVRFDSALATADDIAAELSQVACLITDYSSLYLDFLLTGRPVLFLPYDLESYANSERGLYYEYGDPSITPGPVCRTWEQLLLELTKLLDSPEPYATIREQSLARHHHHVDGLSCSRVFLLASALSGLSVAKEAVT